MRFTLFDRWDNQIGVVDDVISAIHRDELNGEDSLTLTLASCSLVKGNRIVWRDKFGTWHEHIVNDLKDVHEGGRLYTVAYCESSLAELFSDYIEELRPYDVSATIALQRALSVTRWQLGTVTVQGTGSASFYHISSREALTLITERWGGELSATITVSGTHVVSRSVNLTSRGSDYGKRFEWSKDIEGITRNVSSDDVCTALYGYGKGLEAYDEDGQPTGGYERKLTFGEINGGLDYVADEDARQVWGLPDGNGGKKHAFGKVEFSDCEDMAELLSLTRAELQKRKEPKVSYTASVIDLADAGYEFEDVRTGDTVALIDRGLGERLKGRVLCVERDLYNESATVVTLGNIVRTIHDVISDQLKSLYSLRDHAAAWDGAASISDSYINGVIRIWNSTMNATGGYVYQEPGEGITVYDKPEDESPTMAIQLKGAGFRIANSKTSGGDWDWRTFGTGDGFTADCLNVGTIRGGSNFWNLETGDLLFEKGRIASYDNSSYWNLTTGAVSLSSSATIGGQSVSGLLTDISQLRSDLDFTAEQFSVDMEALTTRVGTNETDIASLKLTAQQFSVDLASTNTTITQMQATYGTCSTAAATAAKAVTCADFSLRKGATVTVKFTNKNTAASPTLNVNNSGAKPIYMNGAALPESSYWGAGETMSFIYDGTNWAVMDGAAEAQITANSSDIASLKLTAQQFSVDLQSVNTAIQTTNQNLADTNGVVTSMQATYATCATAGGTTEKAATCQNFVLRNGAMVTVKFTYKNTATNPALNVNGTGAKPIILNGSAIPEEAYWAAGQTMSFVYNGTDWVVTDGATAAQVVTNMTDISSLKLSAQQFSVDISSHTESITQLKATYCTCTTAGATQEKEAACSGFSLRTGAIVAVKFSYANTVASPKLNVNGTGAKPIYLNGSALPEDNWWKANDVVTFVYNGTYWYVADGSTLTQLASTNGNVANLTLRADAFDVSIKGIQATYASCSTAATTQTKEVTIANFTKYTGQTVTIRFTFKNDVASPKLTVQNSDGSVAATGYIYVNGAIMSEYYWWKAGETLTLVWDGSNWRVGDGGTMSRIKVLEDSITLSVTGSLGGTASIKLSVNGDEQSKTIDLSKVRQAFRDDNTAITISAGTVTFNSNTFVVNSTNFSVTSSGVITATSGTIGGFTITSSQIYNDKITLYSSGIRLKYGTSKTELGLIGTNSLATDSSKYGLNFDLEAAGAYMTWAVKASSSASTYDMKLTYANKSLPVSGSSSWTSGRLHVTCNLDLHNYTAYNFWIDPDSGGAEGGITGTMNFVKVDSMSSDGTVSNWTTGCKMQFKRGMLVSATF